ncbi:unnamed protein product [Clonostachys chloroleuca]|uniref:CHAT domain-containing protein n=1 Tax=Clonostachys chloroleuca TaxID=1926264 RepID=A0AA35M2R3_9HYPO|nr:unnamed protein product [Clonostachys chloroleuca]
MGCLECDFGDRYAAFHQPSDLDKAIKFGEKAISLMQDMNDRATALMNIAQSHVLNYRNSKERPMEDFGRAAQYLKECIVITPLDNPRRTHRVWGLGELYAVSAVDIFSKIENITDLIKEEAELRVKAARLLCEALYIPSSPVVWRINSGMILYDMLGEFECWEGQANITWGDALVTWGCSRFGPQNGKPPAVALEILENTRRLIAGATHDICADASILESQHPELAQTYSRVCQQIRISTSQGRRENDSAYRAQKQFDEVLGKIQSLPGFKYFPLSSSRGDLPMMAENKHIVIVDVSQYGCGAFIVHQGEVLRRDLPLLRLVDVERQSWNPTPTTELLAWLWDCIEESILDMLGFREYPGDGHWPRVCWILTGSLARFPIHAATSSQWTSSNGSSDSVMDRVISSYSPSIRALSRCQQPSRRNQLTSPHQRNMIVVGMDKTLGHGSLPFMQEEVRQLGSLSAKMNLELHELSKKTELLALLPNCEIFHFAGHGLSNSRDPSQSCLLLRDWEKHPLTVANLCEMDIKGKNFGKVSFNPG